MNSERIFSSVKNHRILRECFSRAYIQIKNQFCQFEIYAQSMEKN